VDLTVAVDELDGRFRTSLDRKPNAAYRVDHDGVIRYHSLRASDERVLPRAPGQRDR
jgi:hypothetical protein